MNYNWIIYSVGSGNASYVAVVYKQCFRIKNYARKLSELTISVELTPWEISEERLKHQRPPHKHISTCWAYSREIDFVIAKGTVGEKWGSKGEEERKKYVHSGLFHSLRGFNLLACKSIPFSHLPGLQLNPLAFHLSINFAIVEGETFILKVIRDRIS